MKSIWKIIGFIGIVIVLASVLMLGKGIVKTSNYQEKIVVDMSSIDWGFGIEPRQPISTLKIIKPLKLAFDTRLVTPPKPDNIYSYYYIMVTPSKEVSAVVGFSDYKSWDECVDTQKKLVDEMALIVGKPETRNNKGKFVNIFPINTKDYGDIRINCQPLSLPNVKARLMKIYNPSDELLNETFSTNQEKLKEVQNKLKNNKSIFLKK
jgi:hypothetical protein